MNTRTLPLSAVLMAAALSAAASPGPSGSLMGTTGNPFAPNGSGYGSFNVGAPDAKSPLNTAETFTCVEAYVVQKPCTQEQVKYRNGVLASLRCPEPYLDACKTFLMLNGPAGAQAAQGGDPLTQPEEFYKKCGTIPYRACTAEEAAKKEEWLSAKKKQSNVKPAPKETEVGEIVVTAKRGPTQKAPQPGDDEFIGPLQENASVNTSAAWNSQFEAIKEKTPTAINLGNETYIVPDPNDPTVVQECGAMMCRRVDAAKYQDKLDAAKADANMFTGNSVPNKPPKQNVPPVVGQQNPVNPNPNGGGSASDDGNDVASVQRAIGRSGDSATSTGSSWTGTGSGGTVAAGGEDGKSMTVKQRVDGAIANDGVYEFDRSRVVLGAIKSAQDEVNSGRTGLVTTDGRTEGEVQGRLVTPPTCEKENCQGKMQFSANGPEQK